jgi:hypothetical protein
MRLCHRTRVSWNVTFCLKIWVFRHVTLCRKFQVFWGVTLCHRFRVMRCGTVPYDLSFLDVALCHRIWVFSDVTLCYWVRGSQHFKQMLGTTHSSGAKQYRKNILYIALILTKLLFVIYRTENLYEFKENPVNYILSLHFRNERGTCYNMNIVLLQCVWKFHTIGKSDLQKPTNSWTADSEGGRYAGQTITITPETLQGYWNC